MPSSVAPLDSRVQIVTPENIAFEYRVAGPFRRLAAYLFDVLLRVMALVVIGLVLLIAFGSIGLAGTGFGMVLVVHFLLDWFYGGLFETFWNGQTPGKRLLKLRVVNIWGQPIKGWQAMLRNVLRAADALPVVSFPESIGNIPTYQVGLVVALCNGRFQRLGDLACGTMVIVEEPQALFAVARIDDPDTLRLAAQLPANLQVGNALGRALSAYVQRRRTLSGPRRAEMARHLAEPLLARYNLPASTSYDRLLCAVYHVVFVAARPSEEELRVARSPFAQVVAVDVSLAGSGGPPL